MKPYTQEQFIDLVQAKLYSDKTPEEIRIIELLPLSEMRKMIDELFVYLPDKSTKEYKVVLMDGIEVRVSTTL